MRPICHRDIFDQLNLQSTHLSLNHNQESTDNLGAWAVKKRCFSMMRSILNELTAEISNDDIGTVTPARVILERVFGKIQQQEEMMTKDASLSENDDTETSVEPLYSNLQEALSALRIEEDLQDAGREVLLEQAKLDQRKEDFEQREQEISVKQKQMKESLKKANCNVAFQFKQIEYLNFLVKEQSERIAASQISLSQKEFEMCKLRNELIKKDQEAEALNSELESQKELLDAYAEVIRKQEEELTELQREVREKERDLADSLQLREVKEKRLNIIEANLENQTVVWLLAREELKALLEQASGRMNDLKETSEEFDRVRAVLSDTRFELVSSQQSLASLRKKMEDQMLFMEKKVAELQDQKLHVVSYMNNLKDTALALETKLIAGFDEPKSQISGAGRLMVELEERFNRERATLEPRNQEIASLRKELGEKEFAFSDVRNLLQVRESEMLKERLKIEKLKVVQDIIKLTLQEKDADLLKAQDVLAEVCNDIADLQKLMNSKEQQFIEATTRLREMEDRIEKMQLELGDMKAKFHKTGSSAAQLAQPTNMLALPGKGEDRGEIIKEELPIYGPIKQLEVVNITLRVVGPG